MLKMESVLKTKHNNVKLREEVSKNGGAEIEKVRRMNIAYRI